MKKNILLTLVLTIVMFATAQAQSQDYGISITLANGTTINLTADEVSNITFANGAVTVSGTTIQELVNSVANTDSASTMRNDEQDQRINMIEMMAAQLATEITNIQTNDATMQTDIAELKETVSTLRALIDQVQMQVNNNAAYITTLQNVIANLNERVAALEAK